MHRGQPVVLHGDGSPTRRYLYAADAADAFDTILHKGEIGHVYNVGSSDELSNLTIAKRLLALAQLPQDERHGWIQHTHDRPFNDQRYAVNGSKLRQLGWQQKMSFEEGLALTVDWYKKYGEQWWGDITHALTPFPVVAGNQVLPDVEAESEMLRPRTGNELLPKSPRMVGKKRKLDVVVGA